MFVEKFLVYLIKIFINKEAFANNKNRLKPVFSKIKINYIDLICAAKFAL